MQNAIAPPATRHKARNAGQGARNTRIATVAPGQAVGAGMHGTGLPSSWIWRRAAVRCEGPPHYLKFGGPYPVALAVARRLPNCARFSHDGPFSRYVCTSIHPSRGLPPNGQNPCVSLFPLCFCAVPYCFLPCCVWFGVVLDHFNFLLKYMNDSVHLTPKKSYLQQEYNYAPTETMGARPHVRV